MPQTLERVGRGERVDPYETLRRRKDGSLVEISLTVSPVRDDHGTIVGASRIARDISSWRRLEEERELRVRELRHRIQNLIAIVGAIARQTTVEGSRQGNIGMISQVDSPPLRPPTRRRSKQKPETIWQH